MTSEKLIIVLPKILSFKVVKSSRKICSRIIMQNGFNTSFRRGQFYGAGEYFADNFDAARAFPITRIQSSFMLCWSMLLMMNVFTTRNLLTKRKVHII